MTDESARGSLVAASMVGCAGGLFVHHYWHSHDLAVAWGIVFALLTVIICGWLLRNE